MSKDEGTYLFSQRWWRKSDLKSEVDHEKQYDSLSDTHLAISGAFSGFTTRALCQPFDVLKIRFQLQVEPITENDMSKYKSLTHATRLIYKEEGLNAFWKGHVPAQFLSISFGLIQFWAYERMSKYARKQNILQDNRSTQNFLCGALAGIVSTTITFPFDIMRTRLIAQDYDRKVYTSLYNAYKHMIFHEGFFGMYKGLTPTIIAVSPHTGLQFMIYKVFDRMYRNMQANPTEYSVVRSLIAGSMSGFISKTLLYPLDLARKRMQIQGFQKYRSKYGASFNCISLRSCLLETYRLEGIKGYFKGLWPSTLKALVSSAITFTSYEAFCHLILHLAKKNKER